MLVYYCAILLGIALYGSNLQFSFIVIDFYGNGLKSVVRIVIEATASTRTLKSEQSLQEELSSRAIGSPHLVTMDFNPLKTKQTEILSRTVSSIHLVTMDFNPLKTKQTVTSSRAIGSIHLVTMDFNPLKNRAQKFALFVGSLHFHLVFPRRHKIKTALYKKGQPDLKNPWIE